jgi:hypothetical protein
MQIKAWLVVAVLCTLAVAQVEEISVDPEHDDLFAPEICGSILAAVYRKTNLPPKQVVQNCSFVHLRQFNNKKTPCLAHVNPRLAVCNDTKPNQKGVPLTAINFQNRTFYWFSGVGNQIWSISVSAGRATPLATMPDIPANFTIGLEYTNGTLYLIATDAVYLVANGLVQPIQFIKFLQILQTGAVTSYKGILYLFSGPNLHRLDPLNDMILDPIQMPDLRKVSFAKYRSKTNTLIAVENDSLFEVDPLTGKSTLIVKVAPGIVAMALVDSTVYLSDATKLYSVDLASKKLLSTINFDGASLFGSFQYFG